MILVSEFGRHSTLFRPGVIGPSGIRFPGNPSRSSISSAALRGRPEKVHEDGNRASMIVATLSVLDALLTRVRALVNNAS